MTDEDIVEEEKADEGEDDAPTDSTSVEEDEEAVAGLDDWEREFQVSKYKVQFKPEIFAANAGFDTFYGVSGLAQLSLSDVLGDHRLTLITSLNFSIEDSDFFLTYAYLKQPTNYFTQVFHTRLFFSQREPALCGPVLRGTSCARPAL